MTEQFHFFFANYMYVYTYDLYAQTMIFLYWSAHTVHLNVDTLPQPQRLCGLENKNQTLFLGPPECTRKLQVYV